MASSDPAGLAPDEGSGDPLVDEARRQVVAARLRRGSLVASGKLGNLASDTRVIPPLTVPGYRLLRELHRGGQAVVYLATQRSTGREVALKAFRTGTLDQPAERGRFEREVDVLTRLKHPNIVTIHDCGRSGENVYLVMDYIAGRTLDAYLAEERPTFRETLLLFAKICDAVHAAQLRGVIHRDLKPANIRVDYHGEPRILDFGLAKWVHGAPGELDPGGMTITGQFVGSLPWASPEQARGMSDTLDLRTDVYSLGVMFYQLLTGEFPYPVGGRMEDVLAHIAATGPARPSSLEDAIDHEMETILLKCLAKEPERRYQTAGELALDLRRYLSGDPIEAKRDSIAYNLRKQLRKHKGVVAASLAFVLLLAGGFSVAATQWYRAEQALLREEAQRESADQRAREAQKIAEFQASMLANVDIAAMARHIKEALREQVRLALIRQEPAGAKTDLQPKEAVESELAVFDRLTAPTQMLDLARSVLGRHLLEPAVKSVSADFADQPLVEAQLSSAIGATYLALGLPADALPPLRKALTINRQLLGENDTRTIDSITRLGLALQEVGQLVEAEPLLREALELRRRVLGSEHADTLSSLNNLGALLYIKGEPGASAKVLTEALDARRRILGDEHRETIGSMLNLTNSLRMAGRLTQAEAYGREALILARRVLKPDDPRLASAFGIVGGVLHDLGKTGESEPLLQENVRLLRELLGDQHADVARAVNNLGSLLQDMGEYGRSEAMLREALAIRQNIFGREHFLVAQSLSNLGLLLKEREAFEQAEPYLREALALFRELVGVEHPATAQTLKRLGWVLYQMGELAEAESMLREAVAIRRKALGDRHPYVGLSLHDLGWFLADVGRCADAEPFFREALDLVEGRYPPGHGNIEKPRIRLAECLTSRAAFAEAESLLAESGAVLATSTAAADDLRAYHARACVGLYEAWHLAEPGQGHDSNAAKWRAELQDFAVPDSPN